MPICVQGSHDSRANEKLAKILFELEKITKEFGLDDEICETSNETLYLYRRGKMLWWTECNEASSYKLNLFIGGLLVSSIEIDRNTRYYTFKDVEGFGIFRVRLEAENRNGQIISEIEMSF